MTEPQRERGMSSLKQCTGYLRELGVDDVPHTNKTYLGHLIAVHNKLAAWGCPPDVCLAGLFHSIYGTELFQGFKLGEDRRSELVAIIGARAEKLAYVNCFMDRATLDAAALLACGPYAVRHRESGEMVPLTDAEFDDLCRVHLADYLEQVPRSGSWDYRRDGYRALAERLRGEALADYSRTIALQPAAG